MKESSGKFKKVVIGGVRDRVNVLERLKL